MKPIKQMIHQWVTGLIIMVITMFGVAPAGVVANGVTFAGGNGTAQNPYLIETVDQLKAIAHNLKAHYRLNADLDLSNQVWIQLGDFEGVFDGAKHTIRNFIIDNGSPPLDDIPRFGFFSSILDGEVKNVQFENVQLQVQNCVAPTGVVAGMMGAGQLHHLHLRNIQIQKVNTTCQDASMSYFVGATIGGAVRDISFSHTASVEFPVMSSSLGTEFDRIYYGDIQHFGRDTQPNVSRLVYNKASYPTNGSVSWGSEWIHNGTEPMLSMFAPTIQQLGQTLGTVRGGWKEESRTQELVVPKAATSVTVRPIATLGATMKVGATVIDAVQGYTVTTIPSSFQLSVTKNDITRTYTITIARENDDATLSRLRLVQAGLHPTFTPATTNYTAVVDYAVTNVDAIAIPSSGTSRVTVVKQPLREGANDVIVTVTAESGRVQVYTIQVIRLGLPINVDQPVSPPISLPEPSRVIEPILSMKLPLAIVRKEENGAKVDEVTLSAGQATALVNELKRTNQTNVTFPFRDDEKNKVDKVRFVLSQEAVQQLKTIDVTFQTPKGSVSLPATVMQQQPKEVTLTMDVTLPSSIADKALQTALPGATVIAAPVDIQYGALGKVKVTVPVPPTADPAALRFFIQHSQGDNELVRGEVNYNANRLPESLSVWIDRFSIFTVVADPYANVTASVKGEAKEGMTLQAVLSKEVPVAKYQWYRGTTAIDGATKSTYTATVEDANATLTVAITLPNGETLKQTTAVVKAKSCLEKATFGCITPKSAATVYELVNGVAVATTKQVTNATVAQAYLPAAYLLSPDGQWTEQVAGMKYTAISPALVAKANSGKLVSWQKQLVMKGQIGMVTTTKPQPLFTNGMHRVGYVQMKQNYRVFGTRQALYQIDVNEFVLVSDVEFQGK